MADSPPTHQLLRQFNIAQSTIHRQLILEEDIRSQEKVVLLADSYKEEQKSEQFHQFGQQETSTEAAWTRLQSSKSRGENAEKWLDLLKNYWSSSDHSRSSEQSSGVENVWIQPFRQMETVDLRKQVKLETIQLSVKPSGDEKINLDNVLKASSAELTTQFLGEQVNTDQSKRSFKEFGNSIRTGRIHPNSYSTKTDCFVSKSGCCAASEKLRKRTNNKGILHPQGHSATSAGPLRELQKEEIQSAAFLCRLTSSAKKRVAGIENSQKIARHWQEILSTKAVQTEVAEKQYEMVKPPKDQAARSKVIETGNLENIAKSMPASKDESTQTIIGQFSHPELNKEQSSICTIAHFHSETVVNWLREQDELTRPSSPKSKPSMWI
uniref:Uncharacterized protein n=1 Tax=Ditylenchus dipsaci TaxID=166011 RepID=A0A915D0W6_9BILA